MSRKFNSVEHVALKRVPKVALLALGGALIAASLIGAFFLLGGSQRVFGVQERVLPPNGDEQAQVLAEIAVTTTPTLAASGPVAMLTPTPSPGPTKSATPTPILTPTATATPTVVPVSAVATAGVATPELNSIASVPGEESNGDGVWTSPAAGLPGPGDFSTPGELNPLTGQPLPAGRRNRRPLIVCINNDIAARPQLGTSRADVMYEYLMEGLGITRFSGIFYGQTAEQIGPIRSARLVNFYMGALYDAGLVCSGASDPVRFALKDDAPFPYLDIDLDDPSNRRYSISVGSDFRTRLRTTTDNLRRWLADWGVERAPSLRGFTFGAVPDGGAPASQITIPYPSVTDSQVVYRYDVASGRYLRFLGGHPHLDGNNAQQLALDNVIVQFLPHQVTTIVEDSLGSKSIRLPLFGGGRAIVFRNGLAFEGSWRSESLGDTPRFYDQRGWEVPLKPGKTWISLVPPSYVIHYQ